MDDHRGFRKERTHWMVWCVIVLVLGVFLIVSWRVDLHLFPFRKFKYGLGDSPFRYYYHDYINDLNERDRKGAVEWNTEISKNYNDPRKHLPPQNLYNTTHFTRKQLIVGIFSAENRRGKRVAARETWIKDIPTALQRYNVEIKYMFVLGNKLRYSPIEIQRLDEEEQTEKDVVYTNTEDVYKKWPSNYTTG